jgi:ubiquinone/menaquinone biosynthesis C-methylase UbiE
LALTSRASSSSSSSNPVLDQLRALFHHEKSPAEDAWKAEHEYAYYSIDRKIFDEHLARQGLWRSEAHFVGQRLMRNLGLSRREAVDGKDVLDIGAGEACLSQALASTFSPRVVWAVDALPKQIFAPAMRGEQRNIEYLVASALSLPFPDESFDLVVAHLFVHHIPEKDALLREFRRVLRPGGEFRCFEPNLVVELVLERGHAHGSTNERALWPWELERMVREVFGDVERAYHWSRLETGRLGLLSPSFRVVARKAGAIAAAPGPPEPTRELVRTGVGTLLLDPAVPFKALAEEQLARIRELSSAGA